jgi:hypothetical protein
LTIISFFAFLSIYVNGQRIVNKLFFVFPKSTSIDTIRKKFPHQFILTLDSSIRLSGLQEEKVDPFPTEAKSFFKPSPSDIHLVDSLMKVSTLKAIINGDSLHYINNQVYKWNNDKATDFYKYKASRDVLYQKRIHKNRRLIKKSDRYYFGYINQEGKKSIVVLFDPKKIKYLHRSVLVGWPNLCDPFIVDMDTKMSAFSYFPM